MKDKITFFILGVMIASLLTFVGRVNNPTAQVDEDVKVFDTVLVKGKLYVGNKDNKIVLEGDDNGTNLILNSNGSTVSIFTRPKISAILISNDVKNKNNNGAFLTSWEKANGDTDAHIRLKDGNGERLLVTDED